MRLTAAHQKEIDLCKQRFLRRYPRDIVKILSVKYIKDKYSSTCDRYEVKALVNHTQVRQIIPRELVSDKLIQDISSSSWESSDSDKNWTRFLDSYDHSKSFLPLQTGYLLISQAYSQYKTPPHRASSSLLFTLILQKIGVRGTFCPTCCKCVE